MKTNLYFPSSLTLTQSMSPWWFETSKPFIPYLDANISLCHICPLYSRRITTAATITDINNIIAFFFNPSTSNLFYCVAIFHYFVIYLYYTRIYGECVVYPLM